ncbi:MAG TPA: DUF3540 domain-containing protein, partial [Polyangium sp.]|nr:DUF3540 domain-containing protein [Polyangium sp.]
MNNAARKIEPRVVYQEFGEVLGITGQTIVVRGAVADVRTKRAASCLLAPGIGDRVLVVVEENGDAFVLAVLERKSTEAATLDTDGDLAIRAHSGKVTIAAQEGIDVVSPSPVRIVAGEMSVTAALGQVRVEVLEVLGRAVKAELGRVKVLATSIDSVLERFTQRARLSKRTIEELDQVHAGHIDYAAA